MKSLIANWKKRSINFSYQSLVRSRFRDKVPSLNVIQRRQERKISKETPNDQRCAEWKGTCKLHEELFRTKRHFNIVHRTRFFRSHVLQKRRKPRRNEDGPIILGDIQTQTQAKVYITELGASWWMRLFKDSPVNAVVVKTLQRTWSF